MRRYVSEQVSHHPPVLAYLADSTSKGWELQVRVTTFPFRCTAHGLALCRTGLHPAHMHFAVVASREGRVQSRSQAAHTLVLARVCKQAGRQAGGRGCGACMLSMRAMGWEC